MDTKIKYWIAPLVVITSLLICIAWRKIPMQNNPSITVNLGVPADSAKSMIGFLHSFNDTKPSQDLIDQVSPRIWRMGGSWLSPTLRNSSLHVIRGTKAKPILLFSDFFYSQKDAGKPWLPVSANLKQVKILLDQVYKRYGNNVVYDLWNEPNHPYFWKESEDTFFNTFKVIHDEIRSLPGGDKAIISGPSIDKFDKGYIERFLTFCAKNNVKLDILSWHDFRSGDKLLQLSQDLQWAKENWVQKYPSLGIKKIQLNEIIGPNDQYSPVVPLVYFKEMETGGADGSCKACWANSKGVKNCGNNSLDGLIDDNGQPRSIWWAYKYYNESTHQRLNSVSSSDNLISFAFVAPDTTNQIRILVGNYKNNIPSLTFNLNKIKSLPIFKNKKSIFIEYYSIPNTGEDPLTGPQLISTKKLNISNLTSPSFSLGNLQGGQVYLLKIRA